MFVASVLSIEVYCLDFQQGAGGSWIKILFNKIINDVEQ